MSPPLPPEKSGGSSVAPQAGDMSQAQWEAEQRRSPMPDFSDVSGGSSTTAKPPQQSAVGRFMRGMVRLADPTDVLYKGEIGRSIMRGLENTGEALAKNVVEAGAFIDDKLNRGGTEAQQDQKREDAKSFRINPVADVEAVYGARSDDPFASFTEVATQIASAVILTRKLAPSGALGLAAQGAVVDAFFFDPYEKGLSELSQEIGAKMPDSMAGEFLTVLGSFAAVDANDGAILARLKRIGEGFVAGKVLEGLVAMAKLAHRGSKGLLSVAEVEDLTAKVEDMAGVSDEIRPVEGRVAVADRADGTFELVDVPAAKERVSYVGDELDEDGIFNATYKVEGGNEVTVRWNRLDDRRVVVLFAEAKNGPGSLRARDLVALRDDFARRTNAKSIDGFRISGANKFRNLTMDVVEDASGDLRFTDRAEAEMQAESINVSEAKHNQAAEPELFTPEEVTEHIEVAERIAKAATPEDARRLLEGTHINFKYMAGPETVKAQIEAVSERIAAAIDAAQGKGGITVEQTFEVARKLAAELGIDNVVKEFADFSENMVGAHVRVILGHKALTDLGAEIAKLSDILRARPHDVAAMTDARTLLKTWYGHMKNVAGVNSNLGRGLRMLQERNNVLLEDVVFGGGKANGAKAAGKEAVDDGAEIAEHVTKEADVAGKEIEAARKVAAQAREAQATKGLKLLDTFDQVPVNASDFSLARARRRAEAIAARLERVGVDLPEFSIQEPASSKRAIDIRDAADAQRADPLPPPSKSDLEVAAEDARDRAQPVNPVEEFSRWLDNAQAELDKVKASAARNAERRAMKARKAAGGAVEADAKSAGQTPVDVLQREAAADKAFETRIRKLRATQAQGARGITSALDFTVDNMTDEEFATVLRLFKMSDGRPRMAEAVVQSVKILQDAPSSMIGKAANFTQKFFINALLSGAKTMETIALSGATLGQFEALVKVAAGAGTFNKQQMQEGIDILFGLYRESIDGVKTAGAAFKAGHSIIDPTPTRYATGGVTFNTVELPGRAAGALDEFTKVVSYRAQVRAKSLRMGRAEGLSGEALARRLDQDLRAAIDPRTGIATNLAILEKARIPTLSGPLGSQTIGGTVQTALNSIPGLRFVVPFMKPGIHSFRYVGKSTPILNRLYSDVRATLAKGGEEAAEIHARSAIAGSITGATALLVATDRITGQGPADRQLRKMWLKNHQPYSVKVGGEWVSYRRMEPFSTFIGLTADAGMVLSELDEDETTGGEIAGALFGALFKNITNKSYTVALSNFLGAVSDGGQEDIARWLEGTAQGFIPNAAQQFNTDPYYREARGLVEKVQSRIPGLSDNLPPRYDWSGDPTMKLEGMWNRNFSVFQSKPAGPAVEDVLVDNGIRLQAPPTIDRLSKIDYNDPAWSTDNTRPYDRWMELVRDGIQGRPGLRKQMENLVKSEEWNSSPEGVPGISGGQRQTLAANLKDAVEEEAFHLMLEEPRYAKLRQAWEGAQQLRGAAIEGGRTAVDSIRKQFGLPR